MANSIEICRHAQQISPFSVKKFCGGETSWKRGKSVALFWLGSGRGGKRRSTRALHLDEAVGAELRNPVGALRSRLCDGAEVGEEPAPRLSQVDELLERGVEGLRADIKTDLLRKTVLLLL